MLAGWHVNAPYARLFIDIEMHEAYSMICHCLCDVRTNLMQGRIPSYMNASNNTVNKYTHKQWQVVCIQNGPLSNDISNWKLNFVTRKCAQHASVCVCVYVLPIEIARKKTLNFEFVYRTFSGVVIAIQVRFRLSIQKQEHLEKIQFCLSCRRFNFFLRKLWRSHFTSIFRV